MNINDILNHLQDYWKELLSTSFVSAIIVIFRKKIEEFIDDIKLFDVLKWIFDKIKDIFTLSRKTKEWRREYIDDKLGNLELGDFLKYKSKEVMDLYVPTRYQVNRPNMDEVSENEAKNPTSEELIPYFLDKIFVKDNPDRFYCVLAETGMGKTTFLVQLLIAYINKYTKETLPFDINIMSIAEKDIIEQINKLKIEDPKKKSILLLDALDENNKAYDREDENGNIISSYEEFRKELEQAVEGFQFVVITCRTQFFPDEKSELKKVKNARHIGQSPDKSLPRYKQLNISPFSDDDINRYIKKKFKLDKKSRQKAKGIIDNIKSLAVRPLILSYIDDLIGGKIKNVLDAYEIIIDKWLQREVELIAEEEYSNRQKELLYDFSRKLAVYIYQNWRKTGSMYLTQTEYEAFKKDQAFNELEFSYANKSLITRDNLHNILFAHKSFLEYFCAEQLFMGEISDFRFEGMNMAKTFFELFCQTKEDKLDIPGEADTVKARRYNNIGWVYYNSMGDYDKALEYYQNALKIREEKLGLEHPDTATSYNNIGLIYKKKGENNKALKYYELSLEVRKKVLGPDHPDTATSYDNIGGVYNSKDEYKKALEYYQNALKIREEKLGLEHPDTASSYNNIGLVYYAKGENGKALKYHKKAAAIREKVLGLDHPDTATSYDYIGNVYREKEDYNEALKYHKKAAAIREKVLGLDHPDTATSYDYIGNVYREKEDYNEALEYHMKAMIIRENVLGLEHPDTATSYNDIGNVYYNKGDYEKALEYLMKAKNIRELKLGIIHPVTTLSYSLIGKVYKKMGKTDEKLKPDQTVIIPF